MLEKIFNQRLQEGEREENSSCKIGREIRKTDVALTTHTLELNCHLSYSAAVGSG